MANRKKRVLYDHDCFVIIPTRKSREVFSDEGFLSVFDSIQMRDYLETTGTKLFSVESIDDGTAVLVSMSIHPDRAISDIVFNLKRISYRELFKKQKIKEILNGEKAIWTRDFVCSTDKARVIDLYDKFK